MVDLLMGRGVVEPVSGGLVGWLAGAASRWVGMVHWRGSKVEVVVERAWLVLVERW